MGSWFTGSSSETTSNTRQVNASQTASGASQNIRAGGGIGNQRWKIKGNYNVTNTYSGLDTAQLGKIFGTLGQIANTGASVTFPVDDINDQSDRRDQAADEEQSVFGAKAIAKWIIGAFVAVAVVAVLKVVWKKKSN